MIIGERLKGYLKKKNISAKEFAEMVGVTEGMVYKYYKMNNIDSNTIEKWSNLLHIPMMVFLDDNMYERCTRDITPEELHRANEYYDNNKEYIHFQNRLLFGDLAGKSREYIESEFSKINPQISYTTGVPYYNVDFIGGFDVVENDQTVNPEYNIDFQKYNEATCWCNVTGHSMEPEITHGDIIALKRIDDFSFLPLGEIYAIVTTNGMRTIKRLGPSLDPNNYTLVPTNKSQEYGVQELPKRMIRTIYHVLGCMKRL